MLVSALINPYGAPARVVELLITGQVVAVVTQELLDELTFVLVRPKFRRWIPIAEAVSFSEELAAYADLRTAPGPSTRRLRDPDDDYLVALAESADAVIVTGDADILDAGLSPLAITPHQLLELINNR